MPCFSSCITPRPHRLPTSPSLPYRSKFRLLEHHRLELINNTNVFLTILDAASARSWCRHVTFWWRPYSWFMADAFSVCPQMVEGTRALSGFVSLLYTLLIPFMRVPSLWPNHLPKAPLPHTISFGGWYFNIWMGGGQTFSLEHLHAPLPTHPALPRPLCQLQTPYSA